MGLGKMLARSTRISVTDTVTGASGTYTVVDNLGPDWPTGGATYRGGMTIPGAWRAANLIADLLGGMPWDAYRRRAGQPVELLDPQPPLLEQPYPQETRVDTISAWVLDYLWEGNAVGVIAARNAENWPTAVVPVAAETVQVRRVKGELKYRVNDESFDAEDILHVKGPHKPGATRGMGVLEAHLDSLTLASEQGRQARSLSRHGVPT
ncbi:MAG TPA: phage portal protein, partial [Pseudonocardia sp.]